MPDEAKDESAKPERELTEGEKAAAADTTKKVEDQGVSHTLNSTRKQAAAESEKPADGEPAKPATEVQNGTKPAA